jgi:hypothetical protein
MKGVEVHNILMIINDLDDSCSNSLEGVDSFCVFLVVRRDGDGFRKGPVVPKDVFEVGGATVGSSVALKCFAIKDVGVRYVFWEGSEFVWLLMYS